MQHPTLLLHMTIDVIVVIVVDRIFALVCYHCYIFSFPPFNYLFPFYEASWCSFYFHLLYFPYFILVLCVYKIFTNCYGFKQHFLFPLMVVYTPHILENMHGFFGKILNIISSFLNFVVYSYTLNPYIFLK